MNIVVLNGSPRLEGNTAALVRAFAEGAGEAGHPVVAMTIGNKNIGGCLACEYCHTKGNGVCIQRDDMQDFYPVLENVEMLVLASPIHYYGLAGRLQCAIQRLYAWKKPPKLRKMALILTSLADGVQGGVIEQYRHIAAFMGAEDAGIVTSYGKLNKSEEKLAEARAFGRNLA